MLFWFFRRLIQSLNGDADKCPSSKLQYHPVFLEFSVIILQQYLKHSLNPVIMKLTVYRRLLDASLFANVCVCFIYSLLSIFICSYSVPCCCSSSRISGLIVAGAP